MVQNLPPAATAGAYAKISDSQQDDGGGGCQAYDQWGEDAGDGVVGPNNGAAAAAL